jgi:hypothetical protein
MIDDLFLLLVWTALLLGALGISAGIADLFKGDKE